MTSHPNSDRSADEIARNVEAEIEACKLSVAVSEVGREAIKAFRVSPDAFVQLAFQVAYHRTFGRLDSVYESGLPWLFLGGKGGG